MPNRGLALNINNAEDIHDGEDLDFEISFYEDVIREAPDLVSALILLGDAYTRKGMYEKGLEMDRRLAVILPKDPTVFYNLACDYSLLKDPGQCIEALHRAIKLGYRDFRHMEKDPDLDSVRSDKRYKELIIKYKKR